ncbi:MAG: DUF642 domain-containing protein [Anaerolineales bacterium]|nr:DUF642 domain-containing protein [Anaerolineales bacterium]
MATVVLTAITLATPPANATGLEHLDTTTNYPAQAQNLVTNGDFESPLVAPPLAVYYAPTNFGGWVVDFGSVELIANGYWQAASGVQSVDLSGWAKGGIYQDLSTATGQSYLLRFALAGNPMGAPQIKQVEVRWGDMLVATLSISTFGRSNANMGYQYFEYPIIASTNVTRLKFTSLTDGIYGPVVDDVSVVPTAWLAAKTVNVYQAKVSSSLNYTITVSNISASATHQVNITDTLPASLNYIPSSLTATSGTASFADGIINWAGTLAPSGSVTITFGTTISPTTPGGTTITNSAIISGGGEVITRSASTNLDFFRLYLPSIASLCKPGICGKVKLNGTPVSNVNLELRFFNGSAWQTLTTTFTNGNGDFAFTGIPSLGPGQAYYVRYRNTNGTSGRLWLWATHTLTSYAAGSNVEIGNFDIADIALVSPANGATISLPYPFLWTPRPATPSDSYEFNLYDPNDLDPYAYTDPLGYVNTFPLTGLPPGFAPGQQYVWGIWAYSPDGGTGVSYGTRWVTFSNYGFSAISPNNAGPALIERQHLLDEFLER